MSSSTNSEVHRQPQEVFKDIGEIFSKLKAHKLNPQQAAESLAKEILAQLDIASWWLEIVTTIVNSSEKSIANQEVYVELLACVAKLPPPRPEDENRLNLGWQGKLWKDLPGLGPRLREEWNGPSGRNITKERRIKHWTNMNNFVALMTRTRVKIMFYDLYCIWTLREALESPIDDSGVREDLEWQVPGAAAWIFVIGPEIRLWDRVWPNNEGGGNRAGGGELWKGDPGFRRERWAVWKKQFDVISRHPNIDATTKEVAARAEARMAEIDST